METSPRALPRFDYAALAPDVRVRVETATSRLHDLERRTSKSIIEMGQHLIAVKAEIGRGNFLPWLEAEFGWSDRTAQRMMSVAVSFGDKSDTVSDLGAKVLYALAADSTPEDVRVEFTELAAIGQRVTHRDVRAALDARTSHAPKRAEAIPAATHEPTFIDVPFDAAVDDETGEILEQPAIAYEVVDPSDPASFAPSPRPAPRDDGRSSLLAVAHQIIRDYGGRDARTIARLVLDLTTTA